MTSTRTAAEWVLFSLFAGAVIWQVFVPPPIGLANNGDFGKVAAVFNLTAPTEDEFKFLIRTWHFDPASHWWSGFLSSEHMLVAVAIGINRIFRRDGLFDIRMIGAVHASIYLLAFFLLLPLLRRLGPRKTYIFGLLLIVIFAGAMYAEWMNTFYMDAAAMVFLMLAAVFYFRALTWDRTGDRIAFGICAMLFAGGKAQHAPLALPIIALVLLDPKWKNKRAFRACAATLVIAGAATAWWFTEPDYRVGPIYNVIFMQILPTSDSVETDLRDLGLDSSYRDLIGTYEYQPASPMNRPEFVREFSSKTSHYRILWFALRHPRDAFTVIQDGLTWAGRQRPAMGDFERDAGRPPFAQARSFSVWSDLKEKVFGEHGALYLAYIAALCAANLALLWRTRYRTAVICLIAMTLFAILIATLGDGVEITRHCFLLNLLADFQFAACVAALIAWFAGKTNGISI